MEPAEAISQLSRLPDRSGPESCFGPPVTAGDHTVIPVAEVVYGFGFGWGVGRNEPGTGAEIDRRGGGGGGGGHARGVAVIEVSPRGVTIHPVRDTSAIQLARLASLSGTVSTISQALVKIIRR